MSSFFLLPARQTIHIKEFKSQNIANIQSTSLSKPSQGFTAINFVSAGENILLHMSFRPNHNVIVFNSKTKTGAWGPEERVSFEGMFGPNPVITVYDHGDRYQILFDCITAIYYNKRIQENAVALQYNVDANQTSAFSDHLCVHIYPDLRSICPLA